jgi:hypothetical protein
MVGLHGMLELYNSLSEEGKKEFNKAYFFLEYAGELHIIIFKKKKKVGAEALTNHNTEV